VVPHLRFLIPKTHGILNTLLFVFCHLATEIQLLYYVLKMQPQSARLPPRQLLLGPRGLEGYVEMG
jgi:hypothetical protein